MTEKTTKAKSAAKTKIVDENTFTDRLTEGAREFVKRSTATAKERTDTAFETTKKYNADMEDVLVRAARGYVNILGNIAEAAYVNVNRGIATAEKLAAVKSVSEAMEIQTRRS